MLNLSRFLYDALIVHCSFWYNTCRQRASTVDFLLVRHVLAYCGIFIRRGAASGLAAIAATYVYPANGVISIPGPAMFGVSSSRLLPRRLRNIIATFRNKAVRHDPDTY